MVRGFSGVRWTGTERGRGRTGEEVGTVERLCGGRKRDKKVTSYGQGRRPGHKDGEGGGP